MFINITTFSFKEGGSTITQQLAKNLCLSFKKDLSRKFAEVFIAKDLEDHYSKDEILEMYLNITYLGEGNYGIQAASQYYYHIVFHMIVHNHLELLKQNMYYFHQLHYQNIYIQH